MDDSSPIIDDSVSIGNIPSDGSSVLFDESTSGPSVSGDIVSSGLSGHSVISSMSVNIVSISFSSGGNSECVGSSEGSQVFDSNSSSFFVIVSSKLSHFSSIDG